MQYIRCVSETKRHGTTFFVVLLCFFSSFSSVFCLFFPLCPFVLIINALRSYQQFKRPCLFKSRTCICLSNEKLIFCNPRQYWLVELFFFANYEFSNTKYEFSNTF